MKRVSEQLNKYAASIVKPIEISTGFSELDKLTRGLRRSELTIIAARPSMGKSSLMLDISKFTSKSAPTAIFSLEMVEEQLIDRMFATEQGVKLYDLQDGNITLDNKTIENLSLCNLSIDDNSKINAKYVWDVLNEHPYDVIFVDYLNLFSDAKTMLARHREIGEVTKQLRNIARLKNISVVALCQLNRNLEQRQDKHPRLSDLRECVPVDTEILTKGGWKKHNEIKKGELVLGYDYLTQTTKWCKLKGKVLYKNAEIIKFGHSKFQVETTPEHRWFVQRRICNAKGTHLQDRILTTAELSKNDRVIVAAPNQQQGKKYLTSGEAAMLGWLLTDGTFAPEKYKFLIFQSKKKNPIYCDRINYAVRGYVTSQKHNSNGVIEWRLSSPKVKKLLQKCNIQKISDFMSFIPFLSFERRGDMLKAMQMAEGNKSQNTWAVKDKNRFDIYCLLNTLQGNRLGKYVYRRNTGATKKCNLHQTCPLQNSWVDLSEAKFKKGIIQDVWCPITELHSWVARQNEQIFITGNSGEIEQIADNIILLYRPAYYKIFDEGDVTAEDDWEGELIVAKNRNGPVGKVPVIFRPHLMSFCQPNWKLNNEF